MYIIRRVHHTPRTPYPKFTIHQVQNTRSTPYTKYSIDPVHHTLSTPYTKHTICGVHHVWSTEYTTCSEHCVPDTLNIAHTLYGTQRRKHPNMSVSHLFLPTIINQITDDRFSIRHASKFSLLPISSKCISSFSQSQHPNQSPSWHQCSTFCVDASSSGEVSASACSSLVSMSSYESTFLVRWSNRLCFQFATFCVDPSLACDVSSKLSVSGLLQS